MNIRVISTSLNDPQMIEPCHVQGFSFWGTWRSHADNSAPT